MSTDAQTRSSDPATLPASTSQSPPVTEQQNTKAQQASESTVKLQPESQSSKRSLSANAEAPSTSSNPVRGLSSPQRRPPSMPDLESADITSASQPHVTLLRLGLHALYTHFSYPDYMLPEYLAKWDEKVFKTVLKMSARSKETRIELASSEALWVGITETLDVAAINIQRRSFAIIADAHDMEVEAPSGALITSHAHTLVLDIRRIYDIIAIARNVLSTGQAAQDLCAKTKTDQAVLRLVSLAVRICARGYDGETPTQEEAKWRAVNDELKRMIVCSLQFLNNLITQNERRKLMLWVELFDRAPEDDMSTGPGIGDDPADVIEDSLDVHFHQMQNEKLLPVAPEELSRESEWDIKYGSPFLLFLGSHCRETRMRLGADATPKGIAESIRARWLSLSDSDRLSWNWSYHDLRRKHLAALRLAASNVPDGHQSTWEPPTLATLSDLSQRKMGDSGLEFPADGATEEPESTPATQTGSAPGATDSHIPEDNKDEKSENAATELAESTENGIKKPTEVPPELLAALENYAKIWDPFGEEATDTSPITDSDFSITYTPEYGASILQRAKDDLLRRLNLGYDMVDHGQPPEYGSEAILQDREVQHHGLPEGDPNLNLLGGTHAPQASPMPEAELVYQQSSEPSQIQTNSFVEQPEVYQSDALASGQDVPQDVAQTTGTETVNAISGTNGHGIVVSNESHTYVEGAVTDAQAGSIAAPGQTAIPAQTGAELSNHQDHHLHSHAHQHHYHSHSHEHHHDHDHGDEHHHHHHNGDHEDHDDDHDYGHEHCPHHHHHHSDDGDYTESHDSKSLDEEEEEEEEEYMVPGDVQRGLLTDIPLFLGPSEIEVLPLIVLSGIVPPEQTKESSGGSENLNASNDVLKIRNLHTLRCHLLLARENGRNLLRELLIYIAAWELREEELYYKFMAKIVESILTNGLMCLSYNAFTESKDIISPAQAVIMKLLTHIIRTRHSKPFSEYDTPYPSRVHLSFVTFLLAEFRRHIIPQVCSLIFLQGQIRLGHAAPEEFPLNNWEMERTYEGVHQYLEFFATLAEHDLWKNMMTKWDIMSELVALLRELDHAIPLGKPKAGQMPVSASVPSQPYGRGHVPDQGAGGSASPSPRVSQDVAREESTSNNMVERPYDVLAGSGSNNGQQSFGNRPQSRFQYGTTGNGDSQGHTTTYAHSQQQQQHYLNPQHQAYSAHHQAPPPPPDAADFEWKNLKKLTILVISSLVWKCRTVQDQVRKHGGIETLINCCTQDEYNPFMREHAIMCLRLLLEGNEENQRVVRGLDPRGGVTSVGMHPPGSGGAHAGTPREGNSQTRGQEEDQARGQDEQGETMFSGEQKESEIHDLADGTTGVGETDSHNPGRKRSSGHGDYGLFKSCLEVDDVVAAEVERAAWTGDFSNEDGYDGGCETGIGPIVQTVPEDDGAADADADASHENKAETEVLEKSKKEDGEVREAVGQDGLVDQHHLETRAQPSAKDKEGKSEHTEKVAVGGDTEDYGDDDDDDDDTDDDDTDDDDADEDEEATVADEGSVKFLATAGSA